ncbi:hypothetical protein [Granulicella sibirica]|uniref:Uncharacterized protein n=1 Tax=Granulicella sibirica TaxID=2479048 RepID=A0A4Q0SY41_9BACT|nr:hypothetical protein [Granulicella sibirica]RXH53926.1 hypothetical protein GRAN_4895 [Granulicella sibirica]
MEYHLLITSVIETTKEGRELRSNITSVLAEAELGQQLYTGQADLFFGQLLDASAEQILYFKFAPGVEVVFRGLRYQFEELAESGAFKLVRRV